MACPFFMPLERLQNGAWPHPARLPLGGGWKGHCTAPPHDGEIPPLEALVELCNLGYAACCTHLPKQRAWDAVRFAFTKPKETPGNGNGTNRVVELRYICERDHLPAMHGSLQFDTTAARWIHTHSDARVQRMAECFLESHLTRKEREP